MVTRPKKWIGLSLLSTLLLGIGLGILLDRTVLERVVHSRDGADVDRRDGHGDRTARYLEKLTSELALTSEQRASLREVLEENHDTAHEFWEQSRAEFDELRQSFRRDIRELLTEEQRERYDRMLAEYDARRKERDRH